MHDNRFSAIALTYDLSKVLRAIIKRDAANGNQESKEAAEDALGYAELIFRCIEDIDADEEPVRARDARIKAAGVVIRNHDEEFVEITVGDQTFKICEEEEIIADGIDAAIGYAREPRERAATVMAYLRRLMVRAGV